MDIKESAKFVARKILEKFRRQEDGETGDMNNQVLSPVSPSLSSLLPHMPWFM